MACISESFVVAQFAKANDSSQCEIFHEQYVGIFLRAEGERT